MAIRTIREIGDPVLNKVSKEVKEITPRINELIDDMFETMYEANGVGLAAPQVGILKRIVVIDTTGEDIGRRIFCQILQGSVVAPDVGTGFGATCTTTTLNIFLWIGRTS